jgi:hypothetical protein
MTDLVFQVVRLVSETNALRERLDASNELSRSQHQALMAALQSLSSQQADSKHDWGEEDLQDRYDSANNYHHQQQQRQQQHQQRNRKNNGSSQYNGLSVNTSPDDFYPYHHHQQPSSSSRDEQEQHSSEWTVHTDPDTGKDFYHHSRSGHSQWEAPAGITSNSIIRPSTYGVGGSVPPSPTVAASKKFHGRGRFSRGASDDDDYGHQAEVTPRSTSGSPLGNNLADIVSKYLDKNRHHHRQQQRQQRRPDTSSSSGDSEESQHDSGTPEFRSPRTTSMNSKPVTPRSTNSNPSVSQAVENMKKLLSAAAGPGSVSDLPLSTQEANAMVPILPQGDLSKVAASILGSVLTHAVSAAEKPLMMLAPKQQARGDSKSAADNGNDDDVESSRRPSPRTSNSQQLFVGDGSHPLP